MKQILTNISIRLTLIMVFVFSVAIGYSQKNSLTLEDIYVNNTYSPKRFGPVKWYKGGEGYTSLELSTDKRGKDIVLYQIKSGEKKVLVSSSFLIPTGASKPLMFNNYQFSEDGNYLMIFTNTKQVWRNHTRGDYWVLNIKTKKLTQIGKSMQPSSLMFAKFSPNSKYIAYVSEKNIYVEDISNGTIEQLTFDGKGDIINGTTDWAYEEEFSLRDAFRWSNDSSKIAFWQINTKGVGIFTMINNLDSVYSKTVPFAYPKVGTTNPEAKIGVLNLKDKQITWMKIEGDKRNNYLPRMEWSVRENELVIQQINRKQNKNNVILANAETGISKVIFTEETASWTETVDDLSWVNGGKEFTWKSDRSGWLHLYLISSDGNNLQQITKGDFEVIQSLGIDEEIG